MIPWRTALAAAVVALVLPAIGVAQGLGDVAARARKAREQAQAKPSKAPVRSYTNDDLPEREEGGTADEAGDSDNESEPDDQNESDGDSTSRPSSLARRTWRGPACGSSACRGQGRRAGAATQPHEHHLRLRGNRGAGGRDPGRRGERHPSPARRNPAPLDEARNGLSGGRRSEVRAAPEPAIARSRRAAEGPHAGVADVLIVKDKASLRTMLRKTLESRGFG